MFIYVEDTNTKVITEEISSFLGGEQENFNEVDMLQLLERGYDSGGLDLEYFPYGVYDIDILSPTEAVLIHESHFTQLEKTYITIR